MAIVPNSDLEARRASIAQEAKSLLDQGITPDTLFFPSLPPDLKKDVALRAFIGLELRKFHTHMANDKKRAWASFYSQKECLDTLLDIATRNPKLKVAIHRPRKRPKEGENGNHIDHYASLYDDRLKEILSRDGLGNTLLFRKLPVDVTCTELEGITETICEENSLPIKVLLVRTAVSAGGSGRNFWLLFASTDACRMAFCHFMKRKVTFRCGISMQLKPLVHDDTTDGDATLRRKRALLLGHQASRSNNPHDSEFSTQSAMLELENLLREQPSNAWFLR